MIPDYQTIMKPLLETIKDGKEYRIKEVIETLANYFQLTNEEREQLNASGKRRFDNRVRWAQTYLLKAGFLQSPRKGIILITERGLNALKSNQKINKKYLSQFDESKQFKSISQKRSSTDEEVSVVDTEEKALTPDELIERALLEINNLLVSELIQKIRELEPSKFERLVIQVLTSMGYGGSIEEAAEVIGRTGDEGIDGVIKQDPLGLDIVYIQAKKWEGTVGRPEIQKFVGALQGKHASKGVFITSGNFSNEAKDYAQTIGNRVILIDGAELARLMINYNVGVSIAKKIEVKRIDNDYFDEI